MTKNKTIEFLEKLKRIASNMIKNQKNLSIDIKLPTNQKDDAQKVKDYIYDRINK